MTSQLPTTATTATHIEASSYDVPAFLSPSGSPQSRHSTPPTGPPRYINSKIDDFLRNAAFLPAREQSGCVYISTTSHNGTTLVKIGSTKLNSKTAGPDARIKKHQLTCGITFDSPVTQYPCWHLPTIYYKHVEKLAHAELLDHRYDFHCACRTKHREYFAVDPCTAWHIVKRWVRFCDLEPWSFPNTLRTSCNREDASPSSSPGRSPPRKTCYGMLKEQWLPRLDWRKDRIAAPTVSQCEGGTESLEARIELWDGFVNVNIWTWIMDDVVRGCAGLFQYPIASSTFAILMYCLVKCLRWGMDWAAWVSLGALLVGLTATLVIAWDKHAWSEPLPHRSLWLVFVLVIATTSCLSLGYYLEAWVLMWIWAAVLLAMILTILGFRCLTVEHLLRLRVRGRSSYGSGDMLTS